MPRSAFDPTVTFTPLRFALQRSDLDGKAIGMSVEDGLASATANPTRARRTRRSVVAVHQRASMVWRVPTVHFQVASRSCIWRKLRTGSGRKRTLADRAEDDRELERASARLQTRERCAVAAEQRAADGVPGACRRNRYQVQQPASPCEPVRLVRVAGKAEPVTQRRVSGATDELKHLEAARARRCALL